MNTPPLNDNQKQALLREAAAKLGKSPAELTAALQKNDAASLTNALSPQNAAKLEALLSDEAARNALLARPELQELLRAWDKKGGADG